MKFKTFAGFAFSSFLLLASCNPQPAVPQTSIPTVKPTHSNSPTPGLSPTSPTPTLSSIQATENATYEGVVRAMQTQAYWMNTEAPATLQARNVRCKDGFAVEQYLDIIRYSNDTWTLFTCSPIPANQNDRWTPGVVDYGTRYTQIIKTDLTRTWTIQHSSIDYSIINRPDAMLAPFRWTADGKYLYLYPHSYPGPSGGLFSAHLRTPISDLYRIDLETGEFGLFFPGGQFDALSLSPNDQYLVYSNPILTDIIHVRNTQDEKDVAVKFNEDVIATGGFVWDSASTRVVFVSAHGQTNPLVGDDTSSTSVFVLSIKNMHVQKILSEDPRMFIISSHCNIDGSWLDENTICLYSLSDEPENWNSYFALNIETGEVELLRPPR